jgi:Domain of unknown function (DUF4157)
MGSRTFDTAAVDKPGTIQARHTGRIGAPEVRAAARDGAGGRPGSPVLSPTGSFLLGVQRWYGNRFAQRLVQPPGGRRPPSPVSVLQPMLRVGSPGDRYERQAELVARKIAGRLPGQGSAGRDVGRREPVEGREAKAAPGLQAPIRHQAGGGRPLASTAARPMEQAFGVDFGRVRVHSDAGSDDLCRWIGARAFTLGDHIFFRRGEQPSASASDRHLLAHELTHVMQ